MTIDKGIQIKNIYYMLAYAYRSLFQDGYKRLQTEPFEHQEDLLASILIKGTNLQIKRGLFRDYVTTEESRKSVRGKILLVKSALERAQKKDTISCQFDDLSLNNQINMVLKVAFMFLLKSQNVKRENKASIRKILIYMQDVTLISPSEINWSAISVNKNNENYLMLLNISRMVIKGYLPTTEGGKRKLWQFSDQEMEMLFQRFVLEYYRYHHCGYLLASSKIINWDLDETPDDLSLSVLPMMKTDITLHEKNDDKALIIDTKYYGQTLQENFQKQTIISDHFYQIFSYVKNYDKGRGVTSGMLLYAQTAANGPLDAKYIISKNGIEIKTLDLNTEFPKIAKTLDDIAEKYFGPHKILHQITTIEREGEGR